ncbi:MAG: hypothetical protein HN428_11045, partial [Proteobacteria bacterium]|nr:hypothetical protein [Pseudomonadota bacterium]
MNAVFRGIPGAALISTLFLLLSLFAAPAPDLAWRELDSAWIAMGALAGVLALASVPSPPALAVRLLQLVLLCTALNAVLGLVHAEPIRGSAQLGFWLLVVSLAFAVWHVMQRFTTGEPKNTLALVLYR